MSRTPDTVGVAVRKQLVRHVAEGRLRPLAFYLRLFPKFEEVVEHEYAQLAGAAVGEFHPDARPVAAPETPTPPAPSDALAAPTATPTSVPLQPSENGERIGPYRIVKELGRGAQGGVYLAEDTRLPRRVALKVLAPHLVGSDQMRARFRREASAVAKLDHPGICTVYEADVDGASPFIAMRLVEGRTLAQLVDESRAAGLGSGVVRTSVAHVPETSSGATERAAMQRTGDREDVVRVMTLFERIARALHAAHEAGLVHRDVKPANVMVTDAGEPVVLDFGLAADLDENAHLTATGTLMGTPAYMSPEQLVAGRVPLDRRTDVYSLGVSLYEALALRHPFHAATREALYHQILNEEPPRLRRVNPALPRDLEVVVETAMSKNRERRYQTALDFAEDLRRVREHEPIRARPAGAIVRLVRWAQRHPAVATTSAALLVTLCAGLVVSLLLLDEARRESAAKTQALARADEEATKKVAALNDAIAARDAAKAAAKRAEGLRLAALVPGLMDESPPLALSAALLAADRTDAYQVRDAAYQALEDYVPALVLYGHENYVERVESSPDGSRIATLEYQHPAVILWDPSDGRLVARVDAHDDHVVAVRFSGDSKLLVTCGDGGELGLWDARTGASIRRLEGHAAGMRSVAFSADGARLATSDADGVAIVWNVARGDAAKRIVFVRGASLDLSPDGARLVVAGLGRGAPAKVIDLADDHVVAEIAAAPDESLRVARFGCDGKRAIVGGDRGSIVWTEGAADARPETTLSVERLRPSLDRRRVFVGSPKDSPKKGSCVIDLETRALVGALVPDWRIGALDATGRTMAIADKFRGSVRDVATGRELAPLVGHDYSVSDVAFLPDGRHVATAGYDYTVRVWDLTQRLVYRDSNLARPTDAFLRRWNSDGTIVAWTHHDERTGRDAGLVVADALDGRTLFQIIDDVRDVSFSPHGKWAAVHLPGGGEVRDARSGAKVCDLPPNTDPKEGGHGSFWSDDEKHVVCCTTRGGRLHAEVLDVPEGRVSATLPPDMFDVRAISFDGARVYSRRDQNAVGAVFDAKTGKIAQMKPHSGMIIEACFSPDGERVVTQSVDTSLGVWNAATGDGVHQIRAGSKLARGCRWSPDGKWVRGVESRMFDVVSGQPYARVRFRDPDWEMKEFLPDGKTVLMVHRRTGDLRALPLDPVAWAREHAPPEPGGNEMIVLGLVPVAESGAFEMDWMTRHFVPHLLVMHADEQLEASHLDASIELSGRVLAVCPRDDEALTLHAAALAARSKTSATTEAERAAREADAERAVDDLVVYVRQNPQARGQLATMAPFEPLHGRARFEELLKGK